VLSKPTLQGGVRSIITLSVIVLSVLAYFNQQLIIDQARVWSYEPTPAIEQIVEKNALSDKAKFIFYASQPVVDGTQAFNDVCRNVEFTVSILGCYTGQKIYVYDIQDEELDGIKEVTAAHELLHAIYERLSQAEKDRLGVLLEAEYEKIRTSRDYQERMAFYATSQPGERQNELHSIIGTEVSSISTELERHYQQYFVDRQKIVAYSDRYISVFNELQTKAEALEEAMSALNVAIESESKNYETLVVELNSDIEIFNQRATSGYYESITLFNRDRANLMSRIQNTENLRNNVNANIARYAEMVDEYNGIAIHSEKLYNSINSVLAPLPSV
jgi:hypothetical protein